MVMRMNCELFREDKNLYFVFHVVNECARQFDFFCGLLLILFIFLHRVRLIRLVYLKRRKRKKVIFHLSGEVCEMTNKI